jgi:hypothetical protein
VAATSLIITKMWDIRPDASNIQTKEILSNLLKQNKNKRKYNVYTDK